MGQAGRAVALWYATAAVMVASAVLRLISRPMNAPLWFVLTELVVGLAIGALAWFGSRGAADLRVPALAAGGAVVAGACALLLLGVAYEFAAVPAALAAVLTLATPGVLTRRAAAAGGVGATGAAGAPGPWSPAAGSWGGSGPAASVPAFAGAPGQGVAAGPAGATGPATGPSPDRTPGPYVGPVTGYPPAPPQPSSPYPQQQPSSYPQQQAPQQRPPRPLQQQAAPQPQQVPQQQAPPATGPSYPVHPAPPQHVPQQAPPQQPPAAWPAGERDAYAEPVGSLARNRPAPGGYPGAPVLADTPTGTPAPTGGHAGPPVDAGANHPTEQVVAPPSRDGRFGAGDPPSPAAPAEGAGNHRWQGRRPRTATGGDARDAEAHRDPFATVLDDGESDGGTGRGEHDAYGPGSWLTGDGAGAPWSDAPGPGRRRARHAAPGAGDREEEPVDPDGGRRRHGAADPGDPGDAWPTDEPPRAPSP